MEKELSQLHSVREELREMLSRKKREAAELHAQLAHRESLLRDLRQSVNTAELTDLALRQAIDKLEETESSWKRRNEDLEVSLAEKRCKIDEYVARTTRKIVNSGARTFDCIKKFCGLINFYDVQNVRERTNEHVSMHAELEKRRDELATEKQRLLNEVQLKRKAAEAKLAIEKVIPSPVVVDIIMRKMRNENQSLALEVMNCRGKLKRSVTSIGTPSSVQRNNGDQL
uniref:Uncharacterized protein n=1 Tax=Trichuris muris TaxID=70415 RepID=A0A5S6QL34_TRIMR